MKTVKSILVAIILVQIHSKNFVQATELDTTCEPRSCWKTFITENPESIFTQYPSDIINCIKQNLDVDTRLNLAMTCWGIQTIVYNPTMNEFVVPGWEYVEQKHQQWSDIPPLCHRILSILNWRLMTILGLHINTSYEPTQATGTHLTSPYIVGNHNTRRLTRLCQQIENAPDSILPKYCLIRSYFKFLNYSSAAKNSPDLWTTYTLENSVRVKSPLFALQILKKSIQDLSKNAICLSRHHLNFLGGPSLPACILEINLDCSLFEVLKNNDSIKKLKETPGLYDHNVYVERGPQLAKIALVWKKILSLDFGATLLSYRLGFFSNFITDISQENLLYGKRALFVSRHHHDMILDDASIYCEATSLIFPNTYDIYECLRDLKNRGIKKSNTISYSNFCFRISRAFQNANDTKEEIRYLNKGINVIKGTSYSIDSEIYKILARAYEKEGQFENAIHFYTKFIDEQKDRENSQLYLKLAILYKKINQYKKAGNCYQKAILLLESTGAYFDPYKYALAANAYCTGGQFDKASKYMNQYEKKEELDFMRLWNKITIDLLAHRDLDYSYLVRLYELSKNPFQLGGLRLSLCGFILKDDFDSAKAILHLIQKQYCENNNEIKHKTSAEFLLSFIMGKSDIITQAKAYEEKPDNFENWSTPFYLGLKFFVFKDIDRSEINDIYSNDLNIALIEGWTFTIQNIQFALNAAKKEGFEW